LQDEIASKIPTVFPHGGDGTIGGTVPSLFWGAGGYSNILHQAPWANREDLYSWKDDFSLVKGAHEWKFGGLFSHNFKDEPGSGAGGGNQQATIQGCGLQTGNCIADLLLVAKIKRAENRIGVVANRVRKNTLMFQALMRFLEKLDIPVIATIRDSQNYVRAAEQGVGIHEMKAYTVKEDLAQWQTLLAWLEPERVLAEQPAPMQEQPAPVAVPATPEAAIESSPDDTAAHDARFIVG